MKEHSVRKLPALNTNIRCCRWTGEHVRTQTHQSSRVLAATVSLSVLSTVSRYQVKNSL